MQTAREPNGRARWSKALGWLPMLALAVILYELTASPALGVAVGCAKFGVGDLRIAWWLRRVDPDRGRGRACSWFFVTRAIARIGFVACLVITILGCSGAASGLQGQVGRQFLAALLVIPGCFVMAALTSWVALVLALRRGVRVWMDATAEAAHEAGVWPPFIPRSSEPANFGPGLVVTCSMVAGGVVLSAIVSLAVFVGMGALGMVKHPLTVTVLAVAILAVIMGILRIGQALVPRIAANSPEECYIEFLKVR